jgi:hypothetical protein
MAWTQSSGAANSPFLLDDFVLVAHHSQFCSVIDAKIMSGVNRQCSCQPKQELTKGERFEDFCDFSSARYPLLFLRH